MTQRETLEPKVETQASSPHAFEALLGVEDDLRPRGEFAELEFIGLMLGRNLDLMARLRKPCAFAIGPCWGNLFEVP